MTESGHVAIIGAPRCATTTLYDHLSTVFPALVPVGKDVFRLVDPSSGLLNPATSIHGHGVDWYRRIVVRPGTVTLEAGAGHLYHDTAREVLAALPIPVVGVLVVRDPIERLLSVHRYFANNQRLVDVPLATWVREQLAGQGDHADETIRCALQQGRYDAWITPWVEAFVDAGHRLVILSFDEVVAGAPTLLDDLADGLGMTPRQPAGVPWSNPSRTSPRSRVAVIARHAGRRVLPDAVRGRIRRSHHGGRPRPAPDHDADLPMDLRSRLEAFYAPTNAWMRAVGAAT